LLVRKVFYSELDSEVTNVSVVRLVALIENDGALVLPMSGFETTTLKNVQ